MKHANKKKENGTVSASDKILFQQKTEKLGYLKKFLNWIIKGVKKSCPN